MTPSEYNFRKEAAEQALDRQVEAWRQKPILPAVAKAVGMLSSLLARFHADWK